MHTLGRIMCECFGSISQLETRPMIGCPSASTNQRPGFQFQLTYVSKTLAHDPALNVHYNFTKFHQNWMKNKTVLLMAHLMDISSSPLRFC